MRLENSFIGARGVGETTERRLWGDGVTHWDEFDPSHLGPKTGERVEDFIAAGRDALDAGDAAALADALPSGEHWRLYENLQEEACFFDIETTGLHADAAVTCVSFHRGGETTTLVRGDDLTRAALAPIVDAPLLVSFNGASFDAPALSRAFDLTFDAPHIDLRYACGALDLSGGLKAVEVELGVERDRPDLSGRDAVRLWREHERGVDGALETLVSYNRDDAANLRPLMDRVAARLHDEVFATACPDD